MADETKERPNMFCDDCAKKDPNYKQGEPCKHMFTGEIRDLKTGELIEAGKNQDEAPKE